METVLLLELIPTVLGAILLAHSWHDLFPSLRDKPRVHIQPPAVPRPAARYGAPPIARIIPIIQDWGHTGETMTEVLRHPL
jgi:hypothetical protein